MRWSVIAMIAVVGLAHGAQAEDLTWPDLKPGETKVFSDWTLAPAKLREAAGFTVENRSAVEFTYFKAPKGRDYVIVTPCCGSDQDHAALFEFSDGVVQPVGLPVGDPRLGFTTQIPLDEITLAPDAKSIRTHVSTPTCEDGDWRYYYSFEIGRAHV